MTGKELIIYILQNNLEDEEVLKDGMFTGFMTVPEAAVKFNVGVSTIRTWFGLGYLKGMIINNKIYLFKNVTDPRKEQNNGGKNEQLSI